MYQSLHSIYHNVYVHWIVSTTAPAIPGLLVAFIMLLIANRKEKKRRKEDETKQKQIIIQKIKSDIIYACERYIRHIVFHEIYGLRATITQIQNFLQPSNVSTSLYDVFVNKTFEAEATHNMIIAEIRKCLSELYLYIDEKERIYLNKRMEELNKCSLQPHIINWHPRGNLPEQINTFGALVDNADKRILLGDFGKVIQEIKHYLNPTAYGPWKTEAGNINKI